MKTVKTKKNSLTDLDDDIVFGARRGFKVTGKFFSEFREFAVKGNAMELAVGVIIGAAFKSVVDSIVQDLVMPPISLLTGSIQFSDRFIVLRGGTFESLADAEEAGAIVLRYGMFIDNLINFLIVGLVIFIAVKQINKLRAKEEKKESNTKKCPFCMEKIHKKATRCPNCTSKLELVELAK